MKTASLRNKAIVVSLMLAMGSAVPALAADAHSHDGASSQALKLNAGKKWATDAPLRKGTTDIRNAIVKDTAAIHAGKLSDAGFNDLAARLSVGKTSKVGMRSRVCSKFDPAGSQFTHFGPGH